MDCVQSAVAAEAGGAARIELCSGLAVGGLTPTLGLFNAVSKAIAIPIFVMIRPRHGDFLYSGHEFSVMKEDVLCFKDKADGFVFGILMEDGSVDVDRTRELISLVQPKPVTFHRAFDMTSNFTLALESAIECGFTRVLTSGGEATAIRGKRVIASLVEQAKEQIIVMPGGGINKDNVADLLKDTRASEFHCSGKVSVPSKMRFRNPNVAMGTTSDNSEYTLTFSDKTTLQAILTSANSRL